MSADDATQKLCEAVRHASDTGQPIQICGNHSKAFYGPIGNGQPVSSKELTGIIEYEPSELYITAGSGTLLTDLEETLARDNQMLPFDPPHYGKYATVGGTVACGLSGPRRPYAFAMRDCILGTRIINGLGEHLKFGGQVVKNVAGYDVSRVMCGAMGTLGMITEVSFKTVPKPENEITLTYECSAPQALTTMHTHMQSLVPVSASYFEKGILYIRLSGIDKVLQKLKSSLGGEELDNSTEFWHSVREHQRDFFKSDKNLWRCIVPVDSTPASINGESVIEWNGGLRWYSSNDDADSVMQASKVTGGHATLFKTTSSASQRFTEPATALKKLHLNLKKAFDPDNILNPGRMYPWL